MEYLTALDISAVIIYVLLIAGISLFSIWKTKRGTVSGYFLAGRSLTWIPVGASLFASNIGSEHFIGLAGSGAAAGIAVGAFEFNALFLLQLLGWVFLPVYIASKVSTLPEYMTMRFGGQRIRIYLAMISMVLYIFTKISVDMYSGALFIQHALNWSIYGSIALLLGLTALVTSLGGLTAVIYTDTLQFLIMISGSLYVTFKAVEAVGGWNELQRKYIEAIPSDIIQNTTCGIPRKDAWVMLRDPVNSDLPWPGFILGQTPASIWYWCADQMIVQRTLAAKSLSHAQGGTLFASWFKILPIFMLIIPGMASRILFTDEIACVTEEKCMAFCGNPVSCVNSAYPRLVLGIMPEGMRGVMLAVMLAALMSDLSSIFNSASTLFALDIWRNLRPRATSKEVLQVGRLFVLVMVAISIVWIPIIQVVQGGQMYIYIQSVAAYLAPPIAAVYCAAIFIKRTDEKGAFWGLMTGLVLGCLRMILDFTFREPRCYEEDTRPWIVRGIHYTYFAVFLFWVTGIIAVVVSLLSKEKDRWRTVRTTFWSIYDESQRPDENEEGTEKLREIEVKEAENSLVRLEEDKPSMLQHVNNWLFGTDDAKERREQQGSRNPVLLQRNQQSTWEKVVLNLNLVLVMCLAIGFYVYFCINPFTEDEIEEIQRMAYLRVSNLSTINNLPANLSDINS